MARYVYDPERRCVVPAGEYYARRAPKARSSLPAPRVLSDGCEFRSMADGQIYTSKAAYRADLRARGLEEVGNDSSLYRERTPIETAPDPEAQARLFDQYVA